MADYRTEQASDTLKKTFNDLDNRKANQVGPQRGTPNIQLWIDDAEQLILDTADQGRKDSVTAMINEYKTLMKTILSIP